MQASKSSPKQALALGSSALVVGNHAGGEVAGDGAGGGLVDGS